MKIMVGLGNPGLKYVKTRHNAGFWVLDQIAKAAGESTWSARFDGLVCDVRLAGERVQLLKPATYMNRSGRSVRQALDFFKVDLQDVLVICDDFNLKLGRLRLRSGGSAGGQNGLKDVILHLGTEEFPRLRVGVGPPDIEDVADFVLSDFHASQRDLVEACVIEAARGAEAWCRDGLAVAMNEFNGKDLSKE